MMRRSTFCLPALVLSACAMNSPAETVEHVWVAHTDQARRLGVEPAFDKCRDTLISRCVEDMESACDSRSTTRFRHSGSGKLVSKEEVDFFCSLDKKDKAARCPAFQQIYLSKEDQIDFDACMTSNGFKLEKKTRRKFNLDAIR